VTLFQIILIAAWAGISGNYFMDYLGFSRPVVSGLVIGLILGDIETGLILGATIEAIFLGIFTVGAALAPDYNLAGIVGVSLGIASGYGAEAAVAVAIPVAMLGQFLMMSIVYQGNLISLHMADRFAKEGRTRAIEITYLSSAIFWFVKGFLPTFLALYYGATLVEKFFDMFPVWLVDSFSIIGGILPAVGFALLLNIIRVSGMIWALFAVGFIMVNYLHFDMIPLAIIAIVIAYIYISLEPKKEVE